MRVFEDSQPHKLKIEGSQLHKVVLAGTNYMDK